MKLLKLEILNLASLDRPDGEVINFEEGALKDSTIFSIVGSTGSGKSTILDAICLALYNRAPRYPRQKGGRNQKIEVYGDPDENEKNRVAPTDCRNIITRGTKFGYSKLTFLANNGTVYRAEWSVRFKTKKFDDVITALYSISDVNGKVVETQEDWEKLPMIIGLDYDQFLRTVLIAQGTFSDFLNAKEDERYALLEKLIGNEELYAGIAAAIKENKDEANREYAALAASVAAYEAELIPEAELEAVLEHIKALELEEAADKKEKKCVEDALAWYASEKKLIESIEKYNEAHLSAIEDKKAHKEAEDRLSLHDVTLPAVGLYGEIQGAEAAAKSYEESLNALKGQCAQAKSDLEAKQKEQEELLAKENQAKTERQNQKPHIDKAKSLNGELVALKDAEKQKVQDLQRAVKATTAASKGFTDNAQAIDKLQADYQKKQAALEALKTAIAENTSKLNAAVDSSKEKFELENKKIEGVDPGQLQAAKAAADEELSATKSAMEVTSGLNKKRQQLTIKQQEKVALEGRNGEIDKELSSLTIAQLSGELEVLRKSYTLMTSENWELHRKTLQEDEACPLCGATHHPYACDETLEPVVSELDNLIKEKEAALKMQEASKNRLENEKSANGGRIEACKETIEALEKSISELEDKWSKLKDQYADLVQDEEVLKTAVLAAEERSAKAKQSLEDYNNLLKTVNKARTEMEAARTALEKYKEGSDEESRKAEAEATNANTLYQAECAKTDTLSKQLTERKKEQASVEAVLAQARADVASKEAAVKSEVGDKDPLKFEQELDLAVQNASEELEKKTKEISAVREGIKEVEGKIQAATDNLETAKSRSAAVTLELDAWLLAYNSQEGVGNLNVDDIAGFHSATDNWEDIRNEQRQLDAEYTRSLTTLENEKRVHKEHQQNKPNQAEEELTARQAELAAKTNTELVEAKARMQRHDKAKAEMGKLYNDIEQAKQTKLDWEQINDAIGGDGKTLRKIAQCYTLRFLIEHANVEIRKFNSRYELMQVKNSLGIRIIDHDRADDIRDTTSLSGGETFIVSLGLALGLSALSSRNISFENLFIDEGFGTLDPETLATVIDSLAMLQSSQGKKVGVISHTDTMSERITTQIRIIKNGNSGSSRIEVWPE